MATKQLPGSETLTPIADFANVWEVSEKTVQNWSVFIYQAFEVVLPSSGAFSDWQIQLLTVCAKHISAKAHLYHAETGERRRLKGAEFVEKMREMRKAGHFKEFTKFQNFQNFQPADDASDDLLAEVGAIVREGDQEIDDIKAAIDQHEDAQIEELAQFLEDSPQRKKGKLLNRLQAGRALQQVQDELPSIGTTLDVAFTVENF